MTDDELAIKKDTIETEARHLVAALQQRLQQEADKIGEHADALVEKLLASAGKHRCPRCEGHGAVERLDSGYMRRFGMREWDGCEACGGDGETRGRGFVADPSDLPQKPRPPRDPRFCAAPGGG